MTLKFKNHPGQVARLLLVLAVIVFVAIIIVYLVMKTATQPVKPKGPAQVPTVPLPVYETKLSNIRFVFESAIDRGQLLSSADVVNSAFNSNSTKDLSISNPGARFIQVTVGAQNLGTDKTVNNAWTVENIVDSKGRNFQALEGQIINPWIPKKSLCGSVLKPAFDPSQCIKIYEVSNVSTGLKIRVVSGKNNGSVAGGQTKNDTALLDLIVK